MFIEDLKNRRPYTGPPTFKEMKTLIGAIMNIGIGSEHFRKSLGGSEKAALVKGG